MKNTILLLAATTALATSAHAATMITVQDFSFQNEAPNTQFATADPGVDNGWYTTSGSNANYKYFSDPGAADGTQVGLLGLGFHNNINVQQTISTSFAANTDYSLTVFGRAITAADGDVQMTLELYDGATVLKTQNYTYNSGSDGDAVLSVLASDVGSNTGNIGIRIIKSDLLGGNTELRVDNVRLDFTTVPEPSSAALLGLGGFALILLRRK